MKNNIKSARENKGYTQQECADMFGVKIRAWQTYEQGVSEPKYELLCKIADSFGVSTDYLLGRNPAPNPFADYGLSETSEKDMLDQYMSFPPEIRAVLMDVLIKLADSAKPESEIVEETTAGELHDRMELETDSEENAV